MTKSNQDYVDAPTGPVVGPPTSGKRIGQVPKITPESLPTESIVEDAHTPSPSNDDKKGRDLEGAIRRLGRAWSILW